VRSDNTNTIVYADSETGDLMELRLAPSWTAGNLSTVGGAPYLRQGVPFGWVRQDKVNSVVYISGGYIFETSLPLGGSNWSTANLTGVTHASPNAAGEPSAYVRSDGTNAVLYRGADDYIYELSLKAGGTWQAANLSSIAGNNSDTVPNQTYGDPRGYKRGDNVNAVVFVGVNGHIWEIRLAAQGWVSADLTALAKGPQVNTAFGSVSPYVRADGVSAVVFEGADGDVWELSLSPSAGWVAKDLTKDSGN
jgi:hypothetical protein